MDLAAHQRRLSDCARGVFAALTLVVWGCSAPADSEHAVAGNRRVETREVSQAEPVHARTVERWDFARWMDGVKDFRTEEPTADRVPALWKGPPAGFNAGYLRVKATDPEAAVELLLLRGRKVRDGRLATVVTAFEVQGAPELAEKVPTSRHWPDNPAGGGLVWRATGFEDGYLALCDARNSRVSVYKMRNRELRLLEEVEHDVRKGVTGARGCYLEVAFVGEKFEVKDDGEVVLIVEDATFTGAGEVGLVAYGASEAESNELLLEEY